MWFRSSWWWWCCNSGEKCHTKDVSQKRCSKSVMVGCPARMSPQVCVRRLSYSISSFKEYCTKSVLQECPTRVSCRRVPTRVSYEYSKNSAH